MRICRGRKSACLSSRALPPRWIRIILYSHPWCVYYARTAHASYLLTIEAAAVY